MYVDFRSFVPNKKYVLIINVLLCRACDKLFYSLGSKKIKPFKTFKGFQNTY